MKISKDTLSVLRSFSSINGSLMLQEGNVIATIAESNNIFAMTEVPETFPIQFGIYDLNEFLSIVSVFKEDAEFDFKEKFVTISDGTTNRIKYYSAGSGIVKTPPSSIKFPEPEITFDLEQSTFDTLRKVASTLKTSDVSIIGDSGELKIVITDKKNSTANSFESSIGSTEHNFKINFRIENLKLFPGNYSVAISSKKISRFINKDVTLTYYIAVEADSTFGD